MQVLVRNFMYKKAQSVRNGYTFLQKIVPYSKGHGMDSAWSAPLCSKADPNIRCCVVS